MGLERYFISGIDTRHDYYPICDRTTARTPIAQCVDGDTAQRITRLLNEDEEYLASLANMAAKAKEKEPA